MINALYASRFIKMRCLLCASKKTLHVEASKKSNVFCGKPCQLIHYALIGAGDKREREEELGGEGAVDYFTTLSPDVLALILSKFPTIESLAAVCSVNRAMRQVCSDPQFKRYYVRVHKKHMVPDFIKLLRGGLQSLPKVPGETDPISDFHLSWAPYVLSSLAIYRIALDWVAWANDEDIDARAFSDEDHAFRFKQLWGLLAPAEKNCLVVSIGDEIIEQWQEPMSFNMITAFMLDDPDVDALRDEKMLLFETQWKLGVVWSQRVLDQLSDEDIVALNKSMTGGFVQQAEEFNGYADNLPLRVKRVLGIAN